MKYVMNKELEEFLDRYKAYFIDNAKVPYPFGLFDVYLKTLEPKVCEPLDKNVSGWHWISFCHNGNKEPKFWCAEFQKWFVRIDTEHAIYFTPVEAYDNYWIYCKPCIYTE